MTRYQVTAPCVVHIPTTTVSGPALGTFYKDAFLPDGVPPEKLKHLLASGMIRDVDLDAPGAEEADTDTPPGGGQQAGQLAVNSRSSKGDLVAFGVSKGGSREELEALTHRELQARYVKADQP